MRRSRWVDSHCHLHMAAEPPDILLARAAAAGVAWVMCPGTDLESSLAARKVAADHPDSVLWAAGLHPHDALKWSVEGAGLLALGADAPAVGEIGLDYYRDHSPRDVQRVAFRSQLDRAAALGKPAIIHTRDSFADVFDEVERVGIGADAVMHCWTGGPRWTRRFDGLGVTFSFAGPVAFETGDTVRRGAEVAPPERSMVETDTPYLSPPPYRTQDNEPARVVLVGRALAEVWGVDEEEVARMTTEHAIRVFGGVRQ